MIGLVGAALLALPGVATADPGNVFVNGPVLAIVADVDDVNRIRVRESATRYIVEDSTATLTPGANCQQFTPQRVDCVKTGVTATRVDLKNFNDRYENLTQLNDTVFAGDGRDVVLTHGGRDTLNGEAGTDTLRGGEGDDWLYGGPASDLLDGGPGIDFCDPLPGPDVPTVDCP